MHCIFKYSYHTRTTQHFQFAFGAGLFPIISFIYLLTLENIWYLDFPYFYETHLVANFVNYARRGTKHLLVYNGISSARIHSHSFYNTTNTDKIHCYALSHLQDDWNQKVSMYDIEHNTFVRGRHRPFTEKVSKLLKFAIREAASFKYCSAFWCQSPKNVLTV